MCLNTYQSALHGLSSSDHLPYDSIEFLIGNVSYFLSLGIYLHHGTRRFNVKTPGFYIEEREGFDLQKYNISGFYL